MIMIIVMMGHSQKIETKYPFSKMQINFIKVVAKGYLLIELLNFLLANEIFFIVLAFFVSDFFMFSIRKLYAEIKMS